MSETGSDTPSGLGARLRAGRERMGLTQLQAAEKLHVDPKVVESLEGERYDALGAPVFVRGHLKRYAELIGEQTFQLLDIYTASTKTALPDLTRMPRAAPSSKSSQLAVPALLVLIAFVMIGVVWWIVQSVNEPRRPRETSAAREVSTGPTEIESEAASAVTGDASTQPGSAAETAGTNRGAGIATTQSSGPVRPGLPNAASGTVGNSATATAVSSAAGGGPATGTATDAAASPATPARGKGLEVTLRFTSDSWVEIYDAKGEKLFYDIGSANSERKISGTPPFRVTFANAPGVSLDVNGKLATVPANAVHEDQAEFVINRSGRIVRARPQASGAQAAGTATEGK